ncbi:class I SAM-dependent methyltransferase [Candidatus Daviesbacteria bacterium]|nr:class I SAM-dependent methyltransferase [Candidatus Daviesbacteria bacterium]
MNKSTLSFPRIYKHVFHTEGWLSEKEAKFLYQMAQKGLSNGEIVEIGSWKGKSTICLAAGSKLANKQKVYAIDPHQGTYSIDNNKNTKTQPTLKDFKANLKLAGVADWVVPVVKTSKEASKNWNKKIRLLFIDGLHDYQNVSLDFKLWSKYLAKGGLIALHDSYVGYKGPQRVFNENILKNSNFSSFGVVSSILYAQKMPAMTFWEKIDSNRFKLLIPLITKLANFKYPDKLAFLIFHKTYFFLFSQFIIFLE